MITSQGVHPDVRNPYRITVLIRYSLLVIGSIASYMIWFYTPLLQIMNGLHSNYSEICLLFAENQYQYVCTKYLNSNLRSFKAISFSFQRTDILCNVCFLSHMLCWRCSNTQYPLKEHLYQWLFRHPGTFYIFTEMTVLKYFL